MPGMILHLTHTILLLLVFLKGISNAYCIALTCDNIFSTCTVSREQHTIAQTRELECTKIVIPEVISGGISAE